jgi:tetraacyldisaccharide 4'-kinase
MNQFSKIGLLPLSLLYGTVVWCRNKLFDYKVLKSKEFRLPIITIGNITVGGTGKTPHTEYLIRQLRNDYKLAILSRGYKRKTRGFRLAGENSTFEEIGDEPLQIKHKFPDVTVAVDSDRVNGINRIIELEPETDIILLDDGYQHRWVTPGINILLIDYHRPLSEDSLLPLGRLREPVSEKRRADIIVVTKMPDSISAIDKRLILMNIDAQQHQTVYFTSIKYGKPLPVFQNDGELEVDFNDPLLSILLVTGIANPQNLIEKLSKQYKTLEHISFPDHYAFQESDIQDIQEIFSKLPGDSKAIITTEKDAIRMLNFEYHVNQRAAWYYVPIEIEFQQDQAESFNRQIIHYVTNNNRNSLLYKKQN